MPQCCRHTSPDTLVAGGGGRPADVVGHNGGNVDVLADGVAGRVGLLLVVAGCSVEQLRPSDSGDGPPLALIRRT